MRMKLGLIISVVLARVVWGGQPEERALLGVGLAEAADLDESAWGEPAAEGGRTWRPLKAGRSGVVPLPAWWGESLRPRRGDSYRAEVRFKDTASGPIRVELFAGLPGRYEIHRIGGLGDGEWKAAIIPVPWDMVMRIPGTDRTEIVFRAPPGADVPVEKVEILWGNPAQDEARWTAETRDWVARVQKEKRTKAKRAEPQTPVIPEELQAKVLIPFVRSTSRLVYDTSAPQEGEAGAPLRVRMATNEIEPAQFGVYANGAELKSVRVSLSPEGLRDRRCRRLSADVELLAAEYSLVRKGRMFPQRLWPAYPVDVAAERSHLFWVNVETGGWRTRPGTYTGRILIEAEGVPAAELALEVEVLPLRLLTMKEAKLCIGGCVKGLLPAHELEFLVRHNQNSINLWYYGFEPGFIRKSKTDFDLDFTIPDDFMGHARRAGIENFVYFLGGNPYGFPDTMHLERELYRRVHYDGDDMMEGRKALLRKSCNSPNEIIPEVRDLYKQWVRRFMAHAEIHHWPEPILTPFDEPAKWVQANWAAAKLYYYRDSKTGRDRLPHIRLRDVDKFLEGLEEQGVTPEYIGPGGAGEWIKWHFKDSCAAIHEAWPEARISGSIPHAKTGIVFLEDVEVFCTNAIHEDNQLGDKVRAGGPTKVFWQYSGTGDDTGPAEGRYAFGFFFAAFGSRGSLCWAYNWGSRFDTSSGSQWLYGWTTPYSVVRAPFFEGMREAWDDRRYIETLKTVAKEAGREDEAAILLEEIFDRAVKTRTAGGRDTVGDFWARTDDPEALDTMRGRIADLIVEMQR